MRALAACALLLFSLLASVPGEETPPPPGVLISARSQALSDALVGTWRSRVGDRSLILRLGPDGAVDLDQDRGNWRIDPGTAMLHLTMDGRLDAVSAAIVNGQLTLTGGSLSAPLVFARDPDLGDFLVGWLGIEANSPLHRWHRLIAIVAWLSAARLALWLVQLVGRLAILSSWGPFRFVFPRQPLRAATLLSLLVNSAKYVLYGVGLGFVLSTFDVDYTTYIASLSVIGLAIGFGSQGLVQDMVTGLFILVESQFDVGDVVEVSGQIGTVQEMGLRMTRLQTIQNQMVTIPNRSIATVARYGPRGLQVELTVSPADDAQAEEVAAMVARIVADLQRQFPAAIMALLDPRIDRPDTGRCLVRVDLDLWPGQQALIDQHLLPRLRAALPEDRFGDAATTAAWHFDRPQLEPTGAGRLRQWLGRRASTGNGS